MQPDPYYQSDPARWVTAGITTFTGLEIVVDENLSACLACRLDHATRMIYVPPGLALDDYQWTVCRAAMRDMWGAEVAPEFNTPPRHLRSVSNGVPRLLQPSGLSCPMCGRWSPAGEATLS